ncbi:hypothetical protein FKM82_001841 [Ascaphus truei]
MKTSTMVKLMAPKHGVEEMTFNGASVKITIVPWLRGKTCGLCGNADGHKHNDLQKPNHQRAVSCSSLVHSWMLPDNSCYGSCTLSRQFVLLENQLIDGQASTCYSLEPVLQCVKGCNPTRTAPIKVPFHCLPKDSAISLDDWQVNPKQISEDFIEEVDAHTNCVCTAGCVKI